MKQPPAARPKRIANKGTPTVNFRTAVRTLVLVLVLVLALVPAAPVLAQHEVLLLPDRDNTLYETDPDAGEVQNEFSNGDGFFLFAGRTRVDAGFRLRRGLLRFDLSVLPAGAQITFAELTLHQSNVSSGAVPVIAGLHRALEEWGEGASDAVGPEGQGAPAQPGDATWYHRLYDTELWTDPGGTFAASASASTTLGNSQDPEDFTFACTPALVADLQAWLADGDSNFGWVIIVNEDSGGTARRFNSRENAQPETRPRLRLVYREPGQVFVDGFESSPACE